MSQRQPQFSVPVSDLLPEVSPLLVEVSEAVQVPTRHGYFAVRAWAFADGSEHLSVQALEDSGEPVPYRSLEGNDKELLPAVRVHSECATGDLLGSFRCDCGLQLEQGLRIIQKTGGYLIYARNHEGRGIGLVNKLRAYALQDTGLDTVDANLQMGLAADQRDYRQVAVILRQLDLLQIRLISNNPAKQAALEALGITVVMTIADEVEPRQENIRYLETKQQRMSHRLHLPSNS